MSNLNGSTLPKPSTLNLQPVTLNLQPILPIPSHLTGEIQSKLAYVDEGIARAVVPASGDQITLYLHQAESPARLAELEEKVQRVVVSMVKGASRLPGRPDD
jgi:hypothetical protein